MTLRTIAVDAPAAGADWSYTVPGKYLIDVTGITATITTGGAADAMLDSSGNNLDGTYAASAGTGYPALVAGLVTGDGARQWAVSVGADAGHATTSPQPIDFSGAFTFEFLYEDIGSPTGGGFVMSANGGAGSFVYVYIGNTGVVQLTRVQFPAGDQHFTAAGAVPVDSAPHHVAVTFDGATALVYVDGALVAWAWDDPPAALNPGSWILYHGKTTLAGDNLRAITDEHAVYPAALTAGEVAAHDGARAGGIDTYEAAVLADTPTMYYHLGSRGDGGRQVTLAIANEVALVELVPSGFAVAAGASEFSYSWQPGIPRSTQVADGTRTTVAVPRLLLPAGYSIGAATLDIEAADQWSDVTIWWDDRAMLAQADVNPYAYPPGYVLIFTSSESVP